jgi:hypothetical protein
VTETLNPEQDLYAGGGARVGKNQEQQSIADRRMTPAAEPRKTLSVSWGKLQRDAKLLARRLLGIGRWTGIASVTRGGLVSAAIIARALDIRLI